jgi:nicotinate-nucleotide--dimethylbenzimidazole phosphoribosyltransferase
MGLIDKTLDQIKPLDATAMENARELLNGKLKPPGSLGRLEDIAVKLAGISGNTGGAIRKKTIIVMCADNGVTEERVSSFPADISVLVAETMLKGISGVSVLARHAGAGLKVVDIGLFGDVQDGRIINRKIRRRSVRSRPAWKWRGLR